MKSTKTKYQQGRKRITRQSINIPQTESKMANPVYTAFVVQNPPEGSDRKALWREVGAVFANRQGDGMTLSIHPQLSIAGRIILMPWKEREEPSHPEGQPKQQRAPQREPSGRR